MLITEDNKAVTW